MWWFHCLNREVFQSDLPDILLRLSNTPGAWAAYEAPRKVYCNTYFLTKQQFVAVLAHELVHHWQAHNHFGNCAHNHSFTRWRRRFRKHGIQLEVYGDVHCEPCR